MPRRGGGVAGDEAVRAARCRLCRRGKKELTRTECCGRVICFTFARYGCHMGHARFTLCGYHHTEGHGGDWKTCAKCRSDFSHVLEMYVWYGTNDRYNFEKLENPPAYEPSHCRRCGRVIVLSREAHSHHPDGSYECDGCWED